MFLHSVTVKKTSLQDAALSDELALNDEVSNSLNDSTSLEDQMRSKKGYDTAYRK
jgi:hypothetical protein